MAGAPDECDLAVVGGGIVGLAVTRELKRRRPDLSAVVLEASPAVAGGQTGANSGVIHAGIYYAPGSLKARLCVEGAREMYDFCEQHEIEHERCGKLIVARDDGELGRLDELERRGRENQVPGLRRLTAGEIAEVEPHCRGVAALHSPNTGIVDFGAVARAYAGDVRAGGGAVATGCGIESGYSSSCRAITSPVSEIRIALTPVVPTSSPTRLKRRGRRTRARTPAPRPCGTAPRAERRRRSSLRRRR